MIEGWYRWEKKIGTKIMQTDMKELDVFIRGMRKDVARHTHHCRKEKHLVIR